MIDVGADLQRAYDDGYTHGISDAMKWIPCSERLPDEDNWTGAQVQYSDFVLMTVYNAEDEETFIDYGYTVDGEWNSDTTDCFVPPWWKVIAWMPLPKPYREDKAERRTE